MKDETGGSASSRWAIVGGGMLGLTLAHRLAQQGRRVVVGCRFRNDQIQTIAIREFAQLVVPLAGSPCLKSEEWAAVMSDLRCLGTGGHVLEPIHVALVNGQAPGQSLALEL